MQHAGFLIPGLGMFSEAYIIFSVGACFALGMFSTPDSSCCHTYQAGWEFCLSLITAHAGRQPVSHLCSSLPVMLEDAQDVHQAAARLAHLHTGGRYHRGYADHR
jgi:hypothetical protein